jgi:SOS-response transcriptional repressor LexA
VTDNQQAILEFIRACANEGEPPPTIREIMEATGISSTSVVNYNLDALQRDGHITRRREFSRGIRLADDGEAGSKLARLSELVQVQQVQIADLQAEMKRLRQMVENARSNSASYSRNS